MEIINSERINKVCAAYPCHKDIEDCTFCWCPFYPCKLEELGGHYLIIYQGTTKEKIWDCSDCNYVHKKEFVDEAHKILKENLKLKTNGADN